jgi:hypothetical protein
MRRKIRLPWSGHAARLAALERGQAAIRQTMMRGFWQAMDRLDTLTLPGRDVTCPGCATTARRETLEHKISTCIFGGGRLERYVCGNCDAIFGPTKVLELDPAMLAADYANLYTDYSEADSTASELRAFEMLPPKPGGRYLNWGCGLWSHSVERLRERGFDAWGYEPSAPGAAAAHVITAAAALAGPYDGIFSNNVIEHLIDPVAELGAMAALLVPGGRMVHASPCYAYAYAHTRYHVFFPLGRAPEMLAQRLGMRVVDRVTDGEFIAVVYARD